MRPTPSDSPLRRLFNGLVEQVFFVDLGLYEPDITDYLGNLLTRFTHMDAVHRLRDAHNRPLQDIAAMIGDSAFGAEVTGVQRTWLIHRHIGDYALFWTGVYPEGLRRFRSPHRRDFFVHYLRQGKRSYAIASDLGEDDSQPPPGLLRRLSEEFELCVHGLRRVRKGWEHLSPHGRSPA